MSFDISQLYPHEMAAAREAVIAGAEPYDAKTQNRIRAGAHDNWPLVRVAAYALLTERNRIHRELKGAA